MGLFSGRMHTTHLAKLLPILVAALTLAALPVRVRADGAAVFLDDQGLGIAWRLAESRWSKGTGGASAERLAMARRQSEGMTVSASVHRRVIPKKDPREGRIDPLETARVTVGCVAGANPRPDLGRHKVFDLPGIRAAYAVAEFKTTSPPSRALAVVLVRDADYVWLEASGPARLLDDATVDELVASITATPFAETDPRVFFEDKDLGLSWRLPSKRWYGQGKAVGVKERLAVAQRGADGLMIEAWLYRGAHPATGRPDASEQARKLCAKAPSPRTNEAFEPGRTVSVKVSGLLGAYAIGEAKNATPPLRTLAVVVVRETDSVWLVTWGPAKLLDDATIAELVASLELAAGAKADDPR